MGLPGKGSVFPVNQRVVLLQPGKPQDHLLFSKTSDVESFFELFFSYLELEINISSDGPLFVQGSVYVSRDYWFVQYNFPDLEFPCVVLI
jgi:hypothetical protein